MLRLLPKFNLSLYSKSVRSFSSEVSIKQNFEQFKFREITQQKIKLKTLGKEGGYLQVGSIITTAMLVNMAFHHSNIIWTAIIAAPLYLQMVNHRETIEVKSLIEMLEGANNIENFNPDTHLHRLHYLDTYLDLKLNAS